MGNLEHYFENLLFHNEDCKGEPNKKSLTKQEQRAVEICANYVLYTIFANRDQFLAYVRRDFE